MDGGEDYLVTCTAGARRVVNALPRGPRCYGWMCDRGCALKYLSFFFSYYPRVLSFVIAGLDPAIYKETGSVLGVRWIPGSSPGMTIKNEAGDDNKIMAMTKKKG